MHGFSQTEDKGLFTFYRESQEESNLSPLPTHTHNHTQGHPSPRPKDKCIAKSSSNPSNSQRYRTQVIEQPQTERQRQLQPKLAPLFPYQTKKERCKVKTQASSPPLKTVQISFTEEPLRKNTQTLKYSQSHKNHHKLDMNSFSLEAQYCSNYSQYMQTGLHIRQVDATQVKDLFQPKKEYLIKLQQMSRKHERKINAIISRCFEQRRLELEQQKNSIDSQQTDKEEKEKKQQKEKEKAKRIFAPLKTTLCVDESEEPVRESIEASNRQANYKTKFKKLDRLDPSSFWQRYRNKRNLLQPETTTQSTVYDKDLSQWYSTRNIKKQDALCRLTINQTPLARLQNPEKERTLSPDY